MNFDTGIIMFSCIDAPLPNNGFIPQNPDTIVELFVSLARKKKVHISPAKSSGCSGL